MPRQTIGDRAYEVLASRGDAMSYRDVAAALEHRSLQPDEHGRRPVGQFDRSVWLALSKDPRVTKVGRAFSRFGNP
jgi:hypothetical protein